MTRVGWVGLGAMGLPMARCVVRAGYEMTAYDIDPGRAASLAADRVTPAASIAEVASGVDVLVLMVATPGQVEAVLYGDRQRIWDQAENRRHAQKALLEHLITDAE